MRGQLTELNFDVDMQLVARVKTFSSGAKTKNPFRNFGRGMSNSFASESGSELVNEVQGDREQVLPIKRRVAGSTGSAAAAAVKQRAV